MGKSLAIIILFFILIGHHTTHAQYNTAGDSLLHLSVPDTTKLRLLSTWIRANAPNLRESILSVAVATLNIAQKTGYPNQIATAYDNLGTVYYFQEKKEEAQNAFQNALQVAEKSGNALLQIRAKRGILNLAIDRRDLVQVVNSLQQIEQLMPLAKGNYVVISSYYNLLCNTNSTLNRWNEVERVARLAIQFNQKHQVVPSLYSAQYHLGKALEKRNMLDSAIFFMALAREGYSTINNQEELAGMTMQIAQILQKQGKSAQGITEMNKAMEIVETNRDSAGIAFVSMEYGKMLFDQALFHDSRGYLLRSLALFKQLNMRPEQKDVFESLSQYYQKTGDYQKALEFFQQFIALKEEIEGGETQKKIAELEARYENTKKEQKISLLNRENNNQRLQIGLLAALTALILLGTLVGFMLYRNRQRKQLLQQQQQWAKKVVDSTEYERRRIASDLHDGIAQQIAAIKMMAGGLLPNIPNTQKTQLEILIKQLNQTGHEVRQLSHQMMPRSLGELGLSAALEDLFWLSFAQTKIHLDTDTQAFATAPNNERDTALYRIAQETVNNILKHAEPSTVSMSLRSDQNTVYLDIADNGKGFASNAIHSLGMQSMEARAKLCGGRLTVTSTVGEGVTIQVVVPL
jgi:signal transduction histidine kinase